MKLIPETIFKAVLPVDYNGWGGNCEIQKRGKKFRIQWGEKIESVGKNGVHFQYQIMTSRMKECDIIPEVDQGKQYGLRHMPIRRMEWYDNLKSCESAYNSSVIQYGIKETIFTEAYDQKHGIETYYYEAR